MFRSTTPSVAMAAASRSTFVLILLALACVSSSSPAQPVPWSHADGTTHWYEAVVDSAGINWTLAHDTALASGGHLATITSQAENDFVFSLVDDPAFWLIDPPTGNLAGPWLGGVQPPGSPEPAGNWIWVTGEISAYVNWSPAEPKHLTGDEDRVHFGDALAIRVPTWSARGHDGPNLNGYIIEWTSHAPDQTVGLFKKTGGSFNGYTLLEGIGAPIAHLIDNDGRSVHSWPITSGFNSGLSKYLLDNGDLLRSCRVNPASMWNGINVGGITGRAEQYAWNGTLVWEFEHNTSQSVTHHDLEVLPNGNVLMIAWDRKTVAEAIAAGRDPARLSQGELWPDKIIEVAPTFPSGGTIVWEWNVWDHLVQDFDGNMSNFGVVANHPELLDLNFGTAGADWNHINSVDYNPQLDQIMLSSPRFNELWIIDHSTTTAEAAGHAGGNSGKGGDILYRWGNPQTYGAGTASDQQLTFQHQPEWIQPGLPGADNLLVFNNRNIVDDFTSIVEIVPPVDAFGNYPLVPGASYGPSAPTWIYTAPNRTDFYSSSISGAQRLPNNNTFITAGPQGNLFEVTTDGEVVWRYENPARSSGPETQGVPISGNQVFRATKYSPNHPALVGQNLVPGEPVELYPPEILARFGSANVGAGARTDVLHANGNAGDVWREVHVSTLDPVTLTMTSPPQAPSTAAFLLYVLLFEPGLAELETQPFGLGVSALPMPLLNGQPAPPLFTLANTAGLVGFGEPLLPVPPAPSTILFATKLPLGTYAMQGLIIDPGSAGAGVSVTNMVMLNIF